MIRSRLVGRTNEQKDANEDVRIAFNSDGRILDSQLTVVNLVKERKWEIVGEYRVHAGLSMQDLTWPGGVPSPPAGTPDKFHIKV